MRSDSDEPLLAGVPAIKSGNVIDGRFFPLLGSAKILTTDARTRASHPT
ncbi:MAG TPA: hypothetical protein VHL50_05485 [Pyrinomonadaceae bacterium]|nr:hypothetical protein [Pyrinomonadaceae bacterium]